MRAARSIVLPAAAALALAGPAAADWLVTRDNARVETRGPWEVRGERVIFTLPNGTLSSLPLADVDLDKSAEATAATAAPAEPPEATPKATRVIDGDDIPRARPPRPAAAETAAQAAPTAAGGTATKERTPFLEGLQVTSWEKTEAPAVDGFEVTGEVRNANRTVAARLAVDVRLVDEDGAIVATGRAFLDGDALAGGQSLRFRRIFENIGDFATAEFEVSAVEVLLGAAAVGDSEP